MLREADAAMYTAKGRGKGVWQVYDASMAGEGPAEIELRADLKQAIDGGDLSVAYQPIVDLATRRDRRCRGAGCAGTIQRAAMPARSSSRSPRTAGLIVPLGRWVLAEACRTVQGWRAGSRRPDDLRLSVNVSPRQLLPRLDRRARPPRRWRSPASTRRSDASRSPSAS